jgi:fermentation-respiration switch protein FrsA (DUF1100 family)
VPRRLRFALVLAPLGLALLLVAGRFVSRAFLFPVRDVPTLPAPADVTVHALRAHDGTPVRALELPGSPGARIIVDFHNNRETAESRIDLGRALHALGFGVLLVEYRGYGGSPEGEPTEAGIYLDAEAALDMLADRGVAPDGIVLSGTSLGTGVAAEMARRGRGARLVLVSPYTSIPDLVSDAAPFLPALALVPDHFDTLEKSAAILVPTLIIHGDSDEIVPFAMGERLSRAIPRARLARVKGGHHGDLFAREGERLLAEIARLGS